MNPPANRPAAPAMLAFLAISLVGWSAPAAAADKAPDQKRAAELQAIMDCRAIADRDARLACFDSAAARLDEAEASGQVVVVSREQVRKVKRDVFGLQLPSLDIFSRAAVASGSSVHSADEDLDHVTDRVKRAWRNLDGRWMVELETGAVWREISQDELSSDPHAGSAVEIKKGVLGSFFMKIDGQPAIRVHRDS